MARDRDDEALQLGQRIGQRRRAIGLSQDKVAELSGLHRNQISLLEQGRRDPRVSTLRKVARALDVAPGDLL